MPTEKDAQLALGTLYAKALMELAQQAGPSKVSEIRDDMDALKALWDADEKFRAFCNSIIIDDEPRRTSLRNMFAGRLAHETLNLLMVLVDHDRLMVLDEVCEQFQRMRDAQLGRAHVQVTSAVPLDDNQRETLRQKLAAQLNREPILHEVVDDRLLGGIVVQYGDRRLDASASRVLGEVRGQMLAAGRRAVAKGQLVTQG